MCEIAKAISHEAKIIVFDEPTAALTESEQMNYSDNKGLEEKILALSILRIEWTRLSLLRIVSVMRDGAYVGTLISKDSTKNDIVNMMVGRVIYEEPKTESKVAEDAPVVLKVEGLNAGKLVRDVSFELHKGEILGFSGLMGAGRTETAKAIIGADPKESGDIYVNGKKVEINTPEDAVKCGIGYLSEDRKRYGLMLQRNVAEIRQ